MGAEASSVRPAEAVARAGAALERTRDAALAVGVPVENLSTPDLALRQAYDAEGQPHGVVCELALTIRSTDVARAGGLVAACVEAGGTEARLQSASFEHSDPSELLVLAREAAFADARARASQLARLAGRELGPVVEIVEGRSDWTPLYRAKAMVAAGPPVHAGNLDATVTLTVAWQWAG